MVTQIISNALILFHIIPVAPSFQEVARNGIAIGRLERSVNNISRIVCNLVQVLPAALSGRVKLEDEADEF